MKRPKPTSVDPRLLTVFVPKMLALQLQFEQGRDRGDLMRKWPVNEFTRL